MTVFPFISSYFTSIIAYINNSAESVGPNVLSRTARKEHTHLRKDYDLMIDQLVTWIKEQITRADCQGAVVGLSGGIDSSVTAALCKKAFPETTLGVIMPCESQPQDGKDAQFLAEQLNIDYKVILLDQTYQTLLKALHNSEAPTHKLAYANIKPRLRMTTLYFYANLTNSLVVGTDNRSELKIGYFTKYGDGGIDITPLGNLVKTEVQELARLLDIPQPIREKRPSAGLWLGQEDEVELGFGYQDLDYYILNKSAEPAIKERIDSLAKKNNHKLKLPPIPDF